MQLRDLLGASCPDRAPEPIMYSHLTLSQMVYRYTSPGSNESREIRLELAMENTTVKSSSYRVTLDAIHNAFQKYARRLA